MHDLSSGVQQGNATDAINGTGTPTLPRAPLPPDFSVDLVAKSVVVFCVIFCTSLFVLLFFLCLSLYCLSVFDLQLLITSLVSSIFLHQVHSQSKD
jgi:hypothetical protein